MKKSQRFLVNVSETFANLIKEKFNLFFTVCTRLFPNTVTRDAHQRTIHQNQEVDTKHFKCPDCPQGFEMREELRIHSFIHFNGEIHTCLDCHQIFKKKRHLIIHMKKHENANFCCQGCGQNFKYKSNLGKHLRAKRCKATLIEENAKLERVTPEAEANIAKNQLISMSANLSKVGNLENAKPSTKIEKFNSASRNVVRSKSRKNLQIKSTKRNPRKVRIVRDSTYICDLCGFCALYKSHMLSHIRSHISSNRHKCLECSETFNTLMKLQKHSLKVHGHGVIGSIMYSKESSQCSICGQMFSKERMKYHMQHHYEEMFQCDHCPKIFKKKTSLQRHFDCNHSTEKRFTCSTCGKSFAKNRILKQHQMIHIPMKLYIQCEICSKLMQVKSLRIHMETKHGDKYKEKPFICECGKSFRYEKQLSKHNESVHVKIDRGINYPCPDCDLIFNRRLELREHSFDHYSGKIFQCNQCEMKFKKRKLLTIHESVHKNVSFQCDFCPMTFQTKGGRRKHITKVHNQQITEVYEIPTNFEFQIDEN